MKTLLELRDEAQNESLNGDNKRLFFAMNLNEDKPVIFNGWFLDPFLNTIIVKDMEDKMVHLTDVNMSKFQATWVDEKD